MKRDSHYNALFVSKKMVLVCNVNTLDAKLRSISSVQEELTIAWRLKEDQTKKMVLLVHLVLQQTPP